MKGSGSAFAGLVCGGEGDPAPEPPPSAPNACTDVKLVMPEFFMLLARSDQPLDGLRQVVRDIGAFQCPDEHRSCQSDDDCQIGSCDQGLCPCQHPYSPLAELLELTFRGLATVAHQGAEPGAVGTLCVTAQQAALLQPAQLNQLCELRRTLDVVLLQQGGQQLLNDPAVRLVVLALIHYLDGTGPGVAAVPHYDLFITLGSMAQNPGICVPADAYSAIDLVLAYLTPAAAQQLLSDAQALLIDPVSVNLLHTLGGSGNNQDQRAGFIALAKGLTPGIVAAPDAQTALAPVNQLLQQFVYSDTTGNFPDSFKAELSAVMSDVAAMLAPATGIFPPAQQLLACAGNPLIDPNGMVVGALYDLLSAQQSAGGIDLGTLLGAVRTLLTLDQTGQLTRTVRGIVDDLASSDDATEAVRELLAQVLTPAEAQKLLPAIDAIVSNNVLNEMLNLLDDVLYSCHPPPPPPAN